MVKNTDIKNSSHLNNLKGIFFKQWEHMFIPEILKEIYIDKIYESHFIGKKDLTILDLGAHIGLFTFYASKYAKMVYAIEPAEEHFKALEHMIKFNKLPAKAFKLAIANKTKKGSLFHRFPTGEKYQKTAFSIVHGSDKDAEPTQCVTLEKFLNDNKLEKVDFVKMDIEGAEFEVLGGDAFKRIAYRIDTIVGEVHIRVGRNYGQIKQSLELNGFEVKFSLPKMNVKIWEAFKVNTFGDPAELFFARRKK